MDRAKAAFFNARQEIAGALAKPADANKAIVELMESLGIDTENPLSSSTTDSTALRALSLLWGSTAEHGDKEISRKIDGYRKRYVASIGGDSDERVAATKDFDKRITDNLLKSLGPRNRSVYIRAFWQQKNRWQAGDITKPQFHEKMAGTARQLVIDSENVLPGSSREERLEFFRNEVRGALAFVRTEKNLIQALNYLWGAKPEPGSKNTFNEFDKVTDDVVSMIVASEEHNPGSSSALSQSRDEAFISKKREFIKEARNYLGSLLPDATAVKEYVEQEADAFRQYMQQDNQDYPGYKKHMLHYLATIRTEVLNSTEASEKARLDSAVEEAVNKLLDDKPEPWFGFKTVSVSEALRTTYVDRRGRESKWRWDAFEKCCEEYVVVSEQKHKSEHDSKRAFMRATQKLLIEKLPNDIKNHLKELLKELDSYSERNFITNSVYNASAAKLVDKVNGKELQDEGGRSKLFLQLRIENIDRTMDVDSHVFGSLQEEVTRALESVLPPDSDPAKTFECLAYFWGHIKSDFNSRIYKEFHIRRNKYMQAHGKKAVSRIPTDCAFIVETRKILVGRMPAEFQEKYKSQQDTLKEFGMSATDIAECTSHFLLSLGSTSTQ